MGVARIRQLSAAALLVDHPAYSPRVLRQFWRNWLISKKGIGSGGRITPDILPFATRAVLRTFKSLQAI